MTELQQMFSSETRVLAVIHPDRIHRVVQRLFLDEYMGHAQRGEQLRHIPWRLLIGSNQETVEGSVFSNLADDVDKDLHRRHVGDSQGRAMFPDNLPDAADQRAEHVTLPSPPLLCKTAE